MVGRRKKRPAVVAARKRHDAKVALRVKRAIAKGTEGIRLEDLLASIKQEYKEHEDLPNTTNPDDWAKISGKKGERIVYVRTLVHTSDSAAGGKSIDSVTTGQYL